MNNILEYFETESFNELMQFTFEEVREVFNLFEYYVPQKDLESFITEGSSLKNWYTNELNKIDEYARGEYENRINNGEIVSKYDEPSYKIKDLEIQTKRKFMKLISKYFNSEVFNQYKSELYGISAFKEEAIEAPYELSIALNRHKDKIYSLLSIIGYYQRNFGYFMSSSDYYEVCEIYSHEVYQVNKSLGMQFRFVNIFLSYSRLKPASSNEEKDESYQSSKFIDIDKISLLHLIQPYLKYNTGEIKHIIEIMEKNLIGKHGGIAWNNVQDEVKRFISECQNKGIMKKV